MPNPQPKQTKEFKDQQFQRAGDIPPNVKLASKPVCVKLPIDLDEWLNHQENKTAWLRQAAIEKYERESAKIEP